MGDSLYKLSLGEDTPVTHNFTHSHFGLDHGDILQLQGEKD